jgi:hypothetical protein
MACDPPPTGPGLTESLENRYDLPQIPGSSGEIPDKTVHQAVCTPPKEIKMSVSGNPVAMYTPSNGQAHIFYRGDGDSRQGFVIEHVFWGEEYYNQPYVPKSEQWVGPNATYIQASRTPPPLAADDPATMFTDDTGQQHIFYVGIDNSLNHVFYDPKRNGLIYEQWESGAAGIPATMYTPGNDNQQHVFYRGTDNGFHQSFYIPGDGLTPETWVTPDQITYGNPATMYSYVGGLYLNAQQHLFYRTFGGGIGHTFWDPSRGRVTEPWWPGGTAVAALGDPATLFSPGADLQQHIFSLVETRRYKATRLGLLGLIGASGAEVRPQR